MDDPIRNDLLKSSDRMKQEAKYLIYCIQEKGSTYNGTSLSIYSYNKSTKYLDGVNICAFGFGSNIPSGEVQ